MFQKLDEVEIRFERLSEQMSDPELFSDAKRYTGLAKEMAEIREIVETYREYRKVKREILGNEELVHEGDAELREMALEELPGLRERSSALERTLERLLLPQDPLDSRNTIVEIRAGTGGSEAALFVADLFRMYVRYAERQGWKVEMLSASETELRGFKEVIALFSGDRVYSHLKWESGVHRVQRVPETEAQGRIHTSAVTVAVMPEAEDVEVTLNEEDLRIDVYRSSGAGGQHVNTTDSAVRMTHIPTGIVVTCQDERSQHKNKAKALKILKSRLLDAQLEARERQQRDTRRAMVGTGDRSERIRTYNFPQNRITDHRIGLTLYKLELAMEGQIDDLLSELTSYYQAEMLKANRDEGASL